jgi:hypothetical protein
MEVTLPLRADVATSSKAGSKPVPLHDLAGASALPLQASFDNYSLFVGDSVKLVN